MVSRIIDGLRRRRPVQLDLEEYLKKMMRKGLDENGHLMPDPTPIAPPIGYKKAPSMVEIVREMVRGERLRQEALAAGHETFEDAEDFDVGDEPDLASSPFENEFDPPLADLVDAGRQEVAKKKKAAPPSDGPGAGKATEKPPEAADGGSKGKE